MGEQRQRFVPECYKGSNTILGWLRSVSNGQTISEICYGVLPRVNSIRCLLRSGTKCETTQEVSYGMLQTVKQQQRFVTECYKGSKNITDLVRNGTKGQITSEVCYEVGQR